MLFNKINVIAIAIVLCAKLFGQDCSVDSVISYSDLPFSDSQATYELDDNWTFYSDSKTQIFTTANDLQSQLNILKYFEKTVYPGRQLGDYSYIDLRVTEQVVVKEKYQKG